MELNEELEAPVKSITGIISQLSLPAPLIIVAQGWPSAWLVAKSLGLGVAQMFVTPGVLKIVGSSLESSGVSVYNLDRFHRAQLVWPAVVVVSGTQSFYKRLQCRLLSHSDVIWSHEQVFRGSHYQQCSKRLGEVSRFCRASNLKSVSFRHSAYGGATNAIHLVAFSPSLAAHWINFHHPPNVSRSIRHSWNPVAKCVLRVCQDVPSVRPSTFPKPLFWDNSLRVEGLAHVCNTGLPVIGPSVFKPGQLICHYLTSDELSRVVDLPLYLDSVLADCSDNQTVPLAYKNAISPTILAFIFWHVWGFAGGGLIARTRLWRLRMTISRLTRLWVLKMTRVLRTAKMIVFC